MSKRALIIGSDNNFCNVIKEFLEPRGIAATIISNYKEGIDKLYDIKPDIAVLEFTNDTQSPSLTSNISNSGEFEVVEFKNDTPKHTIRTPVLILDDTSQINLLFDYIKLFLSNNRDLPETEKPFTDNGNLENVFIPNLILDINQQKKTGVLTLTAANTLNVYFINGTPIFAEGGDIENALGQMLLKKGTINQESYERAIEISASTNHKFGEILVEMGVISSHDLNSAIEIQIKEKLIRSILYTKGTYSFKDSTDFLNRVVTYQISIHEIIFEGIKRYVDPQALEDDNPIVELNPKLKQQVNTIGLKPKELRFVQLLNNNTKIREILETTKLDKNESLKLIYFLALFGIIKIPDISLESIGQQFVSEYTKELGRNQSSGNEIHQEIVEDEIIDLNNELRENEPKLTPELPSVNEDSYRGGSEVPSLDLKTEEQNAVIDKESIDPGTQNSLGADVETDIQVPEISQSTEEPDTYFSTDVQNTLDSITKNEEFPNLELDSTVISEIGVLSDSSVQDAKEIGITLTGEKTSDILSEISNEVKSLDETLNGLNTAPDPMTEDTHLTTNPDNKTASTEDTGLALDLDTDFNNREQNVDVHDEAEESKNESIPQELSQEVDNNDTEDTDIDVSTLLSDDEAISINHSDTDQKEENNSATQEIVNKIHTLHTNLSDKSNYNILEVSNDASKDEIKTSYYSLVRHYHPDAHPNLDSDTKQMAEEILSAITSAYEILSDDQKRDEYDTEGELSELKTQAKSLYDAEIIFNKGTKLLQQRNYEEAEKIFKESMDMNPEEPAYIGVYAWAKFLAAEDKDEIVAETKSALEKAILISNQIPMNYYYLGSIYTHEEDTIKAEKCYTDAINLDPEFIEAKRQLRLIQSRKQDKKKNTKKNKMEKRFWSSIFKK